MGLPVVASDIRGCREVVVADKTGMLVPPRDSIALAAAMESIIRQPALALSMGKAGRIHIKEHFDEEQVIERLIKFYQKLLGGNSHS